MNSSNSAPARGNNLTTSKMIICNDIGDDDWQNMTMRMSCRAAVLAGTDIKTKIQRLLPARRPASEGCNADMLRRGAATTWSS
jgi:hypothetical protein